MKTSGVSTIVLRSPLTPLEIPLSEEPPTCSPAKTHTISLDDDDVIMKDTDGRGEEADDGGKYYGGAATGEESHEEREEGETHSDNGMDTGKNGNGSSNGSKFPDNSDIKGNGSSRVNGSSDGGASHGASYDKPKGATGSNGNTTAPASPPPTPLLKGTLSYNLENRRHVLRGMWNYENSKELPPQRFDLIRNLGPEEDPTILPKDGEFHGSFSLAYYHTTSKGKQKERSKVISESGVKIVFTEKEAGSKMYTVNGQGTNQFGVFDIQGTAVKSAHDGDPTYNVELRKKYVNTQTSSAGADTVATQKKNKPKKSKKNKNEDVGSENATDPGQLPPPSQSFPSNVVCLRGKLTREAKDELGVSEVVHKVTGLWSSGLDIIEDDPTNQKGQSNKFEYEHRCTVPTEVFPLSGRYLGYFYLNQPDGSKTRVQERDVSLKFRPNNAGYYNVEGKGSNMFGKYSISGTLTNDNVLTVFRHFQVRKAKKAPSSGPAVQADGTQTPNQPSSDFVTVPGAPGAVTGAPTEANATKSQAEADSQIQIITLDDVSFPGSDKPDSVLKPIGLPNLGTYSAVSRGVLRINDDGAHTCAGKWAVTREHFNNAQTSNFHFGLEPHHAATAAQSMKRSDSSDDPSLPIFPVDSAYYKGSFKMRRGTTKYQSVIDKQIVLKFRKNDAGSYNVYGKGHNSVFGTFTLTGTLILSGKSSGQVELYRVYPVAQPSSGSSQASTGEPKASVVDSSSGQPDAMTSLVGSGGAGGMHETDPLAVPSGSALRRESTRQTKLPSRLEDGDPEAQLARIMEKCRDILKVLREKDVGTGSFFGQPVDPVAQGIPNYFSVISNPMDLGSIQTKMDNNEIESPEEFARLVRLVFQNAMTFNEQTTHVVHQGARSLLHLFNLKFRDVERMTENLRKNYKPSKAELQEAKKKEKEALKDAKRKQKEETNRKRKKGDSDDETDGKKIKLSEFDAAVENSQKTMAALLAAAPGDGDSATISRKEFSLMLQLMKDTQEQIRQLHSLVAKTSGGSSKPAAVTSAPLSSSSASSEKPVSAGAKGASAGAEKKKAPARKNSMPTKKKELKSPSTSPSPPPAPSPAPAPPPPPPPAPAPAPPQSEDEKPLTTKEKEELTDVINELSEERLQGIIQIIRESALLSDDVEEIDLEIDQLDTSTQRKLQRYAMQFKPRRQKQKVPKKQQQKPPAPAPAPSEPSQPSSENMEPESTGEKRKNPSAGKEEKPTKKSKTVSQTKGKKTSKADSFFEFGGQDGNSDSDSDNDSDSDSSEANSKPRERAPDSKGLPSKRDAFHFDDDGNRDDGGEKNDDDDDDVSDVAPNWSMSKPAPAADDASSDGEVSDGEKDLWGAAREEALAAKQREQERKAREDKMRADQELERQQRLADAAAQGEQKRAQLMEEREKEERRRQKQQRDADDERRKAKDFMLKNRDIQRDINMDETRDLMKQYEESFLDKDLGGSGSPNSDFGF